MSKNRKKKKNINHSNKLKESNQSLEVKKSAFGDFISNKWVKIFIHIISVYIWINFIVDMGTFTSRGTYPNPVLALLALGTFILEWNIVRPYKK